MRWQRLRRRLDRMSWLVLCTRVAALLTVVVPTFVATRGLWRKPDTFGFHDWDVMTAHRHLVREALLEHGEFPAWNPYLCGGFPAWGYIEADTILASPLLPLYLVLELPTALRLEVVSMALVGAAGTFYAASKLSRAWGPRALAVALFAVNGRFGLQIASGHLWHLAYALMPWAIGFYLAAEADRGAGRVVPTVSLGVVLAWMVYAGGIYPLPHTVLALGLLAAAHAVLARSAGPLAVVAAGGAVGVGLSAPKLLPMLSTFAVAPRTVSSTEVFAPAHLVVALTSRAQGFHDRPAPVRPYGWHEWGTYIGWGGIVIVVGALLLAWRRELLPLKLVSLTLLVLGLGAFHPLSPWSLLHAHAPFFGSMHVPARFVYPATFFAGLVVAGGLAALCRWLRPRRGVLARGLDLACAASGLALGIDVALVAARPLDEAMWMVPPPRIERADAFTTVERSRVEYVRRDWADSMYLAMLANTGVKRCYGVPFDGARVDAVGSEAYRGEVWIEARDGDEERRAEVTRRTHNRVEVDVEGVRAGDRLVLNMNAFDGWEATAFSADGAATPLARTTADRVGAVLPDGATSVVFTYGPPRLALGLALAIATCAAVAASLAWARRSARG